MQFTRNGFQSNKDLCLYKGEKHMQVFLVVKNENYVSSADCNYAEECNSV